VASANPDQRVQAQYAGLRANLEGKMHETFGAIDQQLHKETLAGAKEVVGMKEKEAKVGQTAAQIRGMQEQLKAKTKVPPAAWTTPQAYPPSGLEVLPDYRPISQKEWEDDRKLSKKAGSAYYEAMQELQKMLAWRREYGAKPLTPERLSDALTKGQTHLQRAKSAMRKVDDTGARLEASEIEMMGLMENIGSLGKYETQLVTLIQSVTDKMNGRMRTLGHRLKPAAKIEGEAAAQ